MRPPADNAAIRLALAELLDLGRQANALRRGRTRLTGPPLARALDQITRTRALIIAQYAALIGR